MPDLTYRPFGAFRLFLAFLVVQHHYLANLAPVGLSDLARPYEVGSLAVLAFFALSGFVICEAADQIYASRPAAYFANRVLRVAPLFVIVAAATILTFWIFHAAGTLRVERGGVTLPQDTFGSQNILLNLVGFVPFASRPMRYDFLTIAWTLRTEMVFYIALGAALSLACVMRNALRSVWTLGRTSLIVALGTVPLFILALIGRAPETFLFAPYFWFGGALYFVIVKRSRAAVSVLAIAASAILWEFLVRPSALSSGLERAVGAQVALLVVLLGSIAVLAVCRPTTFRSIDQKLGDITYALYLSHLFVMVAILSLTTGYSLMGYLVGVVLSIPVAVGFHVAVEPSVSRIREMVRSGRSGQRAMPQRLQMAVQRPSHQTAAP